MALYTNMTNLLRWEGVDWMHLIQRRDQCRAVVKTVMDLRIPKKAGNS